MASPRELKVDDEILLVHVHPEQAEELHPLVDNNREFLRVWLPWVDKTNTVDDTIGFIKDAEKKYAEKGVPTYKIMYKDQAVGICGLNHVSEDHHFTSIGYWLIPEFNGRGIMTRICYELTRHAFEDLGLNKVEISANSKNKPSRAIPERLGFKEEGTIRDRELLSDGQYGDLVTYGLLKTEFKRD